MGIKNLNKFINKHSPSAITSISYTQLKNKKVGIDAMNILYQFTTAIRSSGSDFENKTGKVTTHIYAILMKSVSLLKRGILPVYVFDGKAPNLKNTTLENRTKIKLVAKEKLEKLEAIETLTEENKKDIGKLMQQTTTIGKKEIKECKEILDLLGVPYIDAPGEADAELAYLVKNNLVDYIVSEDMDLLTFGCTKLIRGLGNKKNMVVIDLKTILTDINLTYKQFVDLCILLGSDYTNTLSGIGMTRAFDLIKK